MSHDLPLQMCDFALALAAGSAYSSRMSLRSSKTLAVLIAVAFCACGAEQALARSKKQPAEPMPSVTMDEGTPIIMQGLKLERPKKQPGATPGSADEEQAKERAERPVKIPRGSSSYVPLLRPQVAPYQPPAINSFSDRVINCNQSFTFNAGVGNNPTNRDAFVRQCAN